MLRYFYEGKGSEREKQNIMVEKKTLSSFSDWLTQIIDESGFSLADVANGTGLAVSEISKLKNGRRGPGLDTVVRIASYFGVDILLVLSMLNPEIKSQYNVLDPSTYTLINDYENLSETGRFFVDSAIEAAKRQNNRMAE